MEQLDIVNKTFRVPLILTASLDENQQKDIFCNLMLFLLEDPQYGLKSYLIFGKEQNSVEHISKAVNLYREWLNGNKPDESRCTLEICSTVNHIVRSIVDTEHLSCALHGSYFEYGRSRNTHQEKHAQTLAFQRKLVDLILEQLLKNENSISVTPTK